MSITTALLLDSRAHERKIAAVLLALAVVYLSWSVPRGWVPFDEGMIGQTAEWVLRGGLPHVHYQEAYTGGLTWLYAAIFRMAGVDLINVRWALFLAASVALLVVYSLVRRYLAPIGAAIATWVALAWSFPNYFAGLPSWWLLICALGCVWALYRHVETGLFRYVALAGVLAGCAIAIKQTGVYLLIAVVISLLLGANDEPPPTNTERNLDRVIRIVVAVCVLVFAMAIMSARLGLSEIAYLLVPIASSSVALVSPSLLTYGSALRSRLLATSIACAMAALPLIILLIPYLATGHLSEFVTGAILLPQRRLAFASAPLPAVMNLTAGIAMMTWMLPVLPTLSRREVRVVNVSRWVIAAGFAVAAFWSIRAHQFVFDSVRAVAAFIPVLAVHLLLAPRVHNANRRRFLVISSSMLAWASLVQFPFGTGAYFCYIMPLAVVAAVAVADAATLTARPGVTPWMALLLVFAVFSMNRGYAGTIGVRHALPEFDVPLDLPRAHLNVRQDQAAAYRRVLSLMETHLQGGNLVAGPDCPEVYYLAGRRNSSGTIFEFLSSDPGFPYVNNASYWTSATVIVVNTAPAFSRPVSDRALAELRVAFPDGERVGPFEVRWR